MAEPVVNDDDLLDVGITLLVIFILGIVTVLIVLDQMNGA